MTTYISTCRGHRHYYHREFANLAKHPKVATQLMYITTYHHCHLERTSLANHPHVLMQQLTISAKLMVTYQNYHPERTNLANHPQVFKPQLMKLTDQMMYHYHHLEHTNRERHQEVTKYRVMNLRISSMITLHQNQSYLPARTNLAKQPQQAKSMIDGRRGVHDSTAETSLKTGEEASIKMKIA